jgi:hypothetical protein
LVFVCGWYAPAALEEKKGFCFFWPSKERNSFFCLDSGLIGTIGFLMTFPAHCRGGLNFSFPSAEKKQNAAAASDAMKGSAKARVVIAAPAKAEDRLGKDSERTICGWFG